MSFSTEQSTATIHSLQKYITELTVYINENNAKYNKNLETLKSYYESEIENQSRKIEELSADLSVTENQCVALRNDKQNFAQELDKAKEQQEDSKREAEVLREKLYKERKNIDSIYEQMEQSKEKFKNEIEEFDNKIKDVNLEKQDLKVKIKNQEGEIERLKADVEKLEGEVSKRYSLPDKLKDIEIQRAKDSQLIKHLKESNREFQKKYDFQTAQVERLKHQNQTLRISNNKLESNLKISINENVTRQKQKGAELNRRLQSTNEKQLFEINELQNNVKKLNLENQRLEAKLEEFQEENTSMSNRVKESSAEKEEYFQEYTKLKQEYEETIEKLEAVIPEYQKKVFSLQQFNAEQTDELNGLRDLLNEMKAMNSLQPLKEEYRHFAEIKLRATNQIGEQNVESRRVEPKHQESEFKGGDDYEEDMDSKWKDLMSGIDGIQV